MLFNHFFKYKLSHRTSTDIAKTYKHYFYHDLSFLTIIVHLYMLSFIMDVALLLYRKPMDHSVFHKAYLFCEVHGFFVLGFYMDKWNFTVIA